MRDIVHGIAVYMILALFLAVQCTSPNQASGGNSSETVIGKVKNADGSPACSTIVTLYPSDYDPVRHPLVERSCVDTTDQNGNYSLTTSESSSSYSIVARQAVSGLRAFITGISATDDTAPSAVLAKPGAIAIAAPETADVLNGYLYIPGTGIAVFLNSSKDLITLGQVPSGKIPSVNYASKVAPDTFLTLDSAIEVAPGNTTVIPFPQWRYSKKLYLNTTTSGAGVIGTVTDFPVLIRLTESNFSFAESMTDGADIRFTTQTGKKLPSQIERWDRTSGRAEIWVTIDTIYGNDSSQSITMYWGNPVASSQPKYEGVFDTADGYQGVWHLGDAAGGQVHDATVNQYLGVSPETANPSIAEGIIGNCRVFKGSEYITMQNTSNSKLNFSENGTYSVSAWVYLDASDGLSHCIVSKGFEQYYLRSTYISQSLQAPSPLWEFVEFSETVKWRASNASASVKQWVLLTGVRQGNTQFLYCNGALVDSTVDVWTNAVSRNTNSDLSIGRFAKAVTVPVNEGYCYFKGSIDEVRILSTAQSPDWIKLCYMNQRSDDRLVVFK